jgi:transcriptional regulator with XRE-family HTH domain
MTEEEFALRLRTVMESKGITTAELIKRSGVSKATIYRILTEQDYNPSRKMLQKLAAAVELKVSELLD